MQIASISVGLLFWADNQTACQSVRRKQVTRQSTLGRRGERARGAN